MKCVTQGQRMLAFMNIVRLIGQIWFTTLLKLTDTFNAFIIGIKAKTNFKFLLNHVHKLEKKLIKFE